METPDNNTFINFAKEANIHTGLEIELRTGRNSFAAGVVMHFNDKTEFKFTKNTRLYLTVKIDALQGTVQ
ncbi:hypothetical protein K7I13_04675 [Brucepastera parasyntrophica]|uniref:hypothetical protein n=1 Tax=Brucepastera parasyntrophica TaxID=2880008 RepID=UPI00210F134B|nr:hypothetical protein [Brucepastera parasyntrophica]ULQ60581.1 hypothetical protein K7I13_04675 [Brucepastera parasyntrophica]